jgi:hypothetical protein
MNKPTARKRDSSSGNFKPVDQVTPSGERICRWRRTAMQKTLSRDWRQCNWVGRKDHYKSHTTHDWSTQRKSDTSFEVSVAELID